MLSDLALATSVLLLLLLLSLLPPPLGIEPLLVSVSVMTNSRASAGPHLPHYMVNTIGCQDGSGSGRTRRARRLARRPARSLAKSAVPGSVAILVEGTQRAELHSRASANMWRTLNHDSHNTLSSTKF